MENYEKKYKEALERAKKVHNEDRAQPFDIMLKVFPELKESEDERMRKALISFLKSPFVNENITDEKVAPWIAWLEKQGEQKPVDVRTTGYWHVEDVEQKPAWSEEDEKIKENLQSELCNLAARRLIKESTCDKYYKWLKSLRPQNHWKPSDEQMEALKGE